MAKGYRRFIRVNGELIPSPRFTKKRDADQWYEMKKRQRDFGKHGFVVSESDEGLTFLDFSRTWIKDRMKNYPAATWKADEQRLRDYLLPELGSVQLSLVSSKMIRHVLKAVLDAGQSYQTMIRVRALASKILGDAFNEELIPTNPVHGVKLKTRRQGQKRPEFLDQEQAAHFIQIAEARGPEYQFIADTGLFLGLRRSEILGLKAADFDFRRNMVTVRRKLESATLMMREGTKAGEFETREVPIPEAAVDRFKTLISKLEGGEYLLRSKTRGFLPPRQFHNMIKEICQLAGIKTSAHKLRHTFGREFARQGGNLKALQAIMGHSSSAVTDRYSNLDGRHIGGSSDAVTYGVKSKVEQ